MSAEQPDDLTTWLRELASRVDSFSYSLNDGCLGDLAKEIEAKAGSLPKRESGEVDAWRNRCHAADREYQELMEKYLVLKGQSDADS